MPEITEADDRPAPGTAAQRRVNDQAAMASPVVDDEFSGSEGVSAPSPDLTSEPLGLSPLLQPMKDQPGPLSVPRPLVVVNDTASATEDGQTVVLPVLANDTGAASVARINGAAVTPGSTVVLASGARIIVNTDGTLSYQVGTAFQSLAGGQTAQDTFTYTASDGGGSGLAPEGVFNLASINGSNGFVINGTGIDDRSGYSVAGIGDVNGDGIDDLLIGALSADPNGQVDTGTSYVVYGRQGGFGTSLDLSGLNGTTGFAINGLGAFDFSGASVSAAGDVNGDGLADFLIGAPWGEAAQGTNAGESYLVFGRRGGFGASLDLTTLNGSTGVVFRGGAAGDGLGFAVSAAGDINGDGIDDLILGAREANGGGTVDSGSSYVVFGQRGGFAAGIDVTALTGANGFALVGVDPSDRSGYSVAAAGDVNGDGLDDLIIGAPQGDPGGRANAGEAYVVFGRVGGFGASLSLGALTGANGFSISGIDAGDHAGWSVASAGDLNGDGRADLVIGALYADPGGRENAGETYVVFGRQGGFGANLDLSTLTASSGFTITGTAALNLTGHTVASAGDFNGDGIDDLLIGALYADGSGGADAGETYLVFGRAGGFGSVLDLASLNGQNGFAIGGVGAGDFSGHSVSAAGDVNNDGFADLIIGAPMADPSGRANAGASYVLFGAQNVVRTANGTVTVTVTGVNDAPEITSSGGGATASLSVAENSTTVTTVTAVDPDAGATRTFSIAGGADAARFAINSSTGVLSFVAAPNFEAPTDQNGDNVYVVDVLVSDGLGGSDVQTVNVTVTNLNEAPVITSNGGGAVGGYTIAENTLGPNPITATDPDAGSNLTLSIIGGADAALFTINAGVLSLVNPPDFEAPTDQNGDNVYEVIVQASDGTLTDTQTINVTVTNANEAPVITSNGGGATASLSVAENSTAVTTVTAVDPDAGATRTFSIAGGADAARFAINSSTGVLTFVAAPNFEAPTDQNGDNVYVVDVLVSDGLGGSDVQTVNVTVTNLNEAPVITSNGGGAVGGYTIAENTLGPNPITATDPDAGSNLTLSIIGGADAALFTINAGVLSLVNPPDFEAPADQNGDNVYEVIVQVSDGTLTDTQTINVTVTNANDAPVITSGGGGAATSLSVTENSLAVTTVVAADPDAGAILVYSIAAASADAARFVINSSTGVLTFVAAPNFEAPTDQNGDNVYVVDVLVSDGLGGSDVQTVNVTVTNLNEAPVITSNGGGAVGSYSIAENTLGPNQILATDPDAGSNLTLSIIGGADAALFTINAGVLSLVNPPDFEAPTDQNGDNVYEVIVQASDGTLTDTQTINVTVTNANEAPVITSGGGGPSAAVTGIENSTVGTTVVASDPDAGTSLTYSIITGRDGSRFVIDSSTGVLTFLTAPDFEAPTDLNGDNVYEVDVRVSDGLGQSDVQTIFINIANANEAPVITSNGGGDVGGYTIFENNLGANPLSATDPDAAANLTYSIIGGADAGLFTINAGVLSLVNPPNFDAPADQNGDNVYEVIIQVSDGSLTDTQTLNVTVINANEAPVITSGGGGTSTDVSAAENGTTVTTVVATDPDAGASLVYSIVAGSADAALFAINGSTGVLTFVNAPSFEAPTDQNGDNIYVVDVQVSDGLGGTDVQTINVTVSDVPEAPMITSDGGGPTAAITVVENGTTVTAVTAVDPDGGGNQVYSINGGADASRFVIDSSTGTLRFAAPADFEAPTDQNGDNVYEVIVQVSDGSLTDTQTINVTVTNANEAPVITSNGGGAVGGYTISENTLGPNPITAFDPDAGATLTYSIIGGLDAALFTMGTGGVLRLINPPNFEAPADQNGDNVYEVIVQVSDGTLTDSQVINLTVTDANEAPVITSNGGGPSGTVSVAEGSRAVSIVTGVDPDAGAQISYSIVGGADAGRFTIDPATGALGFATPPDFETPLDAGGDNNYDIVIQASDGVNADTQNLRITVTDVADNILSLTEVVTSLAVNEGDPFVLIDADVSFVDSGVGYDGGQLTVTGLFTTDLISIRNVGTGSGQISFEAGAVGFQGLDIGTASIGPNGFVVALTANANRAAIEALVEALQYSSTSDVPVATHALNIQVSNSGGVSSNVAAVAVQFTADILNGSAGDDVRRGNRGNDVISGFEGTDTLFGGAGDDQIFGGLGDDILDGGDADDFLDGGQGLDTLSGGDGRDSMRGGADADFLDGQASDDQLDGGGGDDVLDGGTEDDLVFGGSGADNLTGGDGSDRLDGEADDDFLFAGNGEDILSGGAGNDVLAGEEGDDQLSGDGGNDQINGGGGIDIAIFKGPIGSYTVQFITAGVIQVTGPDGTDIVLNCEFIQFDDQTINLMGANNEPPRITSDGGGSAAVIDVTEGQTSVTTVVALDVNQGPITYSIAGGADAALFTIDSQTGQLAFASAPDFEAPTDAGRDNIYAVIVSASDGQIADRQFITVTVLDGVNAPTPSTKDSGPVICYGGPLDEGSGDGLLVLPGSEEKPVMPPVIEDLPERPTLLPAPDHLVELTIPSDGPTPFDALPRSPWDDVFA